MSYLDRSLGEDEIVVHRARFPWVYHAVSWVYLLVLGWIVIGIYLFFSREIVAWTTHMGISSRRVLLKEGWLNITTEELALRTIEEINVSQTFLGRIFGYGTVTVAGTGEGDIEFPPMQNPVAFRAALADARANLTT